MSTSESTIAHERYVAHFGPLNQYVSMADHTLILIDAPSLAEEDHNRAQGGFSHAEWKPGTSSFVEKLTDGTSNPSGTRTFIDITPSNTTSCYFVQPYPPV